MRMSHAACAWACRMCTCTHMDMDVCIVRVLILLCLAQAALAAEREESGALALEAEQMRVQARDHISLSYRVAPFSMLRTSLIFYADPGAARAGGGHVQPRRRLALTAAAAHLAQQAHVRAGEQVGSPAGRAATDRRRGGAVARGLAEHARLGGHSTTRARVPGQGRDPLARYSPRTAAVPAGRYGGLINQSEAVGVAVLCRVYDIN